MDIRPTWTNQKQGITGIEPGLPELNATKLLPGHNGDLETSFNQILITLNRNVPYNVEMYTRRCINGFPQ